MEVYSFLDAAGWSGIHYSILFGYETIIEKILKQLKEKFFEIISNDGLTPLFLCVNQKNWSLFKKMMVYAHKENFEIVT